MERFVLRLKARTKVILTGLLESTLANLPKLMGFYSLDKLKISFTGVFPPHAAKTSLINTLRKLIKCRTETCFADIVMKNSS